jgi:hypothetical protein
MTIDQNRPVQVYRNLHKPGILFSVRQGGKVRGYVDSITLINCKFKHATEKQLQAVRTGPRQVCQWITGMIGDKHTTAEFYRVSCDPKKSDGFTINGSRIDSSPCVLVNQAGCFATLE